MEKVTETTTLIYDNVVNHVNSLYQGIKTSESPIFKIIEQLFTNPIGTFKYLFNGILSLNQKTILSKFEDLQAALIHLFEVYNVNYYTFATFIFILITAIFIHTTVLSYLYDNLTFEKTLKESDWYSLGYIVAWLLVFIFGFINIPFKSVFSTSSLSILYTSTLTLICTLSIATIVFLVFSLICASLPASAISFPAIVLASCAIIKYKYNVNITLINVSAISSFILGTLMIVLLLNHSLNRFMRNFRKTFTKFLKFAPYLFVVFFVSSIFQYLQIASLRSMWNLDRNEQSLTFVLVFLFAWSYYSVSYFNQLFSSAFIHSWIKDNREYNKPKISTAFFRAFNCVTIWPNYIMFFSAIPALFLSINSLLISLYILLSKSNVFLLRILSYLLYPIIMLVNMIVIIFDGTRMRSFLSIVTVEENDWKYYEEIENRKEKEKNIKTTYERFMSIFNIQLVLYLCISGVFLSKYKMFFENYTHLTFPLFVAINILVHCMNSLYNTYLIQSYFDYNEKEERKTEYEAGHGLIKQELTDLETKQELIDLELRKESSNELKNSNNFLVIENVEENATSPKQDFINSLEQSASNPSTDSSSIFNIESFKNPSASSIYVTQKSDDIGESNA